MWSSDCGCASVEGGEARVCARLIVVLCMSSGSLTLCAVARNLSKIGTLPVDPSLVTNRHSSLTGDRVRALIT